MPTFLRFIRKLRLPQCSIRNEPVELEMIFPDELTHRGDVRFSFVANPIRTRALDEAFGTHPMGQSVAARLEVPQKTRSTRKSRPPKKKRK